MKEYKLGLWKIIISYQQEVKDDVINDGNTICDGKSLVMLDTFQDYITFVKLNDNNELELQKLPYFMKYTINYQDKTLEIIVT